MKLTKLITIVSVLFIISCKTDTKTITITNNLDIDSSFETIEISKSDLNLAQTDDLYLYIIKDENGEEPIVQHEDTNNDGAVDMIFFQPKVKAKSTVVYKVNKIPNAELPKREEICFSRFVPERTDDYAWENDKVAFRVYGPTAQKMIEENIEGGTLSSGIDCWLKRVKYPIINKWYKKYAGKTGTYHEDTGEGLDNYHVGTSRGCGGIAIKGDSSYYISKNFIKYKTIMTGPIRTQFSLEYANWNVDEDVVIKEKRIITLDRGNNLTKYKISLDGIDKVSIGLTLHKNDGTITENKKNGWVSYWENLDDSELGTAIVVNSPKDILGYDTYIFEEDDVKNKYLETKLTNNTIVYYAGFGWKKSKQFQNIEEWNTYLNNFSKQLQSPLEVSIDNK